MNGNYNHGLVLYCYVIDQKRKQENTAIITFALPKFNLHVCYFFWDNFSLLFFFCILVIFLFWFGQNSIFVEFDCLTGSKISSIDIGARVVRMSYSPTNVDSIIAILDVSLLNYLISICTYFYDSD